MKVPTEELRPIEILTDMVGVFGLVCFWVSLWTPIPTLVVLAAKSDGPLLFALPIALILIVVFLVFAVLAKVISKAIILRSRIGLVVGGVALLGFAGLLSFSFFQSELPVSQKASSGSMVATMSVLGGSCLIRACSSRKKQ